MADEVSSTKTPLPQSRPDPRDILDPDQSIATPDGLSRAEVKTWLRNLLRADSMADPQAQKAIAMLRKLESFCGPYVLASDIVNHLHSLSDLESFSDSRGRDTGYGIAAELIIKHTYAQLEAMESKGSLLGPTVFKSYCSEIVDTLFLRRNARKGVEAILTLTDWLMAKASDRGEHWALYLEFSEQAISTLIDLAAVKVEEEERKLRAVTRARRLADEDAAIEDYTPALDHETMLSLRNIQRKFHAVRVDFEKTMKEFRPRNPKVDVNSENAEAPDRIGFLQALLRASIAAEFHSFSGLLSERLGALAERGERGAGLKLIRSAASYFELQGDKDAALKLKSIARERYKRAAHLYSIAKDAPAIDRVEEKAGAPNPLRASA